MSNITNIASIPRPALAETGFVAGEINAKRDRLYYHWHKQFLRNLTCIKYLFLNEGGFFLLTEGLGANRVPLHLYQ